MDIYTSTLIIFRDKYKGQIPSMNVNKCMSILVWMNMKEASSILKYTSTIIIFKDEYSISYS